MYPAQVERDEDGRWSAWVDELPGCAAWGHMREQALEALDDAIVAYVDDLVEAGEAEPTAAVLIVQHPR